MSSMDAVEKRRGPNIWRSDEGEGRSFRGGGMTGLLMDPGESGIEELMSNEERRAVGDDVVVC